MIERTGTVYAPLSIFLLSEAYVRNENIDWLKVFNKIKKLALNEISSKDFFDFLDSLELEFEIIKGEELVGGKFNVNTRKIIIQLTQDVLFDIMIFNDEELRLLADTFYVNFTHEDTHRQQQTSASDYDIFKNYKNPTQCYWNEDLSEDFDYYNQQIEADAYGREIGARLEITYKNKSLADIFFDINANKIKDDYSKKIINVYKDPRISDKANRSFFKAMYDYLNKNEIKILKELKTYDFIECLKNIMKGENLNGKYD